jgi:CubicO group peptidase (beta-lactamase class C family)
MRSVEVLERGMADGLHIGAQCYVAHRGETVLDLTIGEVQAGIPMAPDSMMIWFSMTKAVTAVAVAREWERGNLDLEAPAARYLPEFGTRGKEAITLRHLLTHTAGIPNSDGIMEGATWRESAEENLARICAAPLEYVPGTRAGYHPAAGMTVLGAVVAAVSGTAYTEYVRREIFVPLGMDDCWVGMPEDVQERYGDRIGRMHATDGGAIRPLRGVDSPRAVATPMPGAGGRGPMRQLARLYEALLHGGVLEPVTVAAISARHRTGMIDETFGVVADWGLGLAIDTTAMGPHCSRRAFGHGGHLSSVAFCDPEHDLVVALVCNGMPERERHEQRMHEFAAALYVDLGIAAPDAPGRAKEFATKGL